MKQEDISCVVDHEKLKLHIIYIIIISIVVIAIFITTSCYWNIKFVDEVSFAVALSSIILSIIAIIVTINGEQKSNNTKNKLENVSDNLVDVSRETKSKFEDAFDNLADVSQEINAAANRLNQINDMKFKIEELNKNLDGMDSKISHKMRDLESTMTSLIGNEANSLDSEDNDSYIKTLKNFLKYSKNNTDRKIIVCTIYWINSISEIIKTNKDKDFKFKYCFEKYNQYLNDIGGNKGLQYYYLGVATVFANNVWVKKQILNEMEEKYYNEKSMLQNQIEKRFNS
ncbi:hypothetical protein [Clostridium sp. AWRP]|uniref:hypothetical protein n=1 Tax=Clostridium sp. AWRP TaxID=2212991 RepID=UPI000FDCC0BB|nr:hypothetical protein [Clostridium sp. AWRP]AZV58353.1 hypothetical protein DMR38_18145 [Clostridium sp. AWRP]